MKVTSNTGASNIVQGKVDYIVKERGKLYVSIDEQLYSLDDLDRVIDLLSVPSVPSTLSSSSLDSSSLPAVLSNSFILASNS